MKALTYLIISLLCAVLSAPSAGSGLAHAAAPGPVELLLKFRTTPAAAEIDQFAARYGGQHQRDVAGLDVAVLRFPAGTDRAGLLARLRADAAVAYAEPNARASASLVPDDPGYPNQWGLPKIGAPQGWDVQSGSATTIIAVVDTGISGAHPELVAKLLPGWNYDAFSPGYGTADASDDNGHGTHVAGIAAAATNNALGVAGTCPACALMPVKVLGADGSGTYDAVAQGIIYAADHGARIVNLSLGGSASSQTLQDAVSYAVDRGVLVVAAAGNDGTNITTYPAALPGVMAVAASDSSDLRASYSNYSSYISVTAPGSGIYSTLWSAANSAGYGYKSGTSMATPFVAGLAGLLAAQDPGRTSAMIRTLIEQSADDINAPGWDQYTGYGRINVARALTATISGTVVDAVTGATLVNATVEAVQGAQVVASTLTQADGSYRLLSLPAGSYTVRASLAGYTTQTRTGVSASTAQITSGVNFSLSRVGAISGSVTAGRKALPGATVQARQGTLLIASAVTDASGSYQLPNLPAGSYSLTASASGYQSQTRTGVVVNPGQTTGGVNFALAR